MSPLRLAAHLALLALLLPATAEGAEVLIDDPENPGLLIDDPENPGSRIDDPENPGLLIDDPENPAGSTTPQPPPREPSTRSTLVAVQPPTQLRGRWATQLEMDFKRRAPGEETLLWRSEVGARLAYPLGHGDRLVLEGRLSAWVLAGGEETGAPWRVEGERTRAFVEPELRALSWRGSRGPWRFRVGHQQTVWGSSDLLRPADVINARDFRRGFSQNPGEQRIPQPTVEVSVGAERWAVTAVVVPFFVPHRVPLVGTRYALLRGDPSLLPTFGLLPLAERLLLDPSLVEAVEPLLLQSELPGASPANASVGLRADWSGRGWDAGLGWFFGWDRLPRVEVDPVALEAVGAIAEGRLPEDLNAAEAVALLGEVLGGRPLVRSRYARRHWLVADGVAYTGPVGWRTEWAFSPSATTYLQGGRSTGRPTLTGVAGPSWEGNAERLLLTTEAFVLKTWAGDEALAEASPGELEAGAAVALRARPFAAPSPEARLGERVEVQLVGVHAARAGLLALAPSLRLELRRPIALEAGAQVLVETRSEPALLAEALRSTGHLWARLSGRF